MAKRQDNTSRGETAWLAAKADMARRNDEARARGAERHAAYEAQRAAYRLAGQREVAADRPVPPGGPS